MELSKIIKKLEIIEIIGNTNVEIKEIVSNSNLVVKNCLFVCLKGGNSDGHDFIGQVERYGAKAVIVENKINTALTQIVVRSSRKALAIVASEFYDNPDKKMKIVGVLGTNGKTTTSHLISSILKYSGIKCGLIGTLGIYYNEKFIEPTLTTPDPLELYKILSDMYKDGIEVVVMEVSAHAVYWDKVYGLKFEIGVFTNLSLDHLDFFDTMENYREAKLKFFKQNDCKYVITNSDDNTGREILKINKKSISYGIDNPADVFAINVESKQNKSVFVINLFDCIYEVNLNLIGDFNVYNALAASTVATVLGVSMEKVINGLESVKGVEGRLEKIVEGDFDVYVDYAHTPDGLEKSLQTLRKACHKRLINVFGCGGNRDNSKREIMGEISGKLADFTVITSDNPRFEEPMEIINQIEKGILRATNKYIIVQDRAEAINYALNYAKKGDVVLIAGKGSEKYQEIFGIKRLYNDKDTVKEILRGENF